MIRLDKLVKMFFIQVLSTSRCHLILFLVSFLTFIMFPILVMSQSYLATRCEDDTFSNYTSGSQFQNNLKRLLGSLYDHGSSSNFAYQTTEGSYPDKVHGLFICRGDLSTDTCQDCLDVANGKIQSDCQYKKEGTIWYDECVVRYSHTFFFGNFTLEAENCICYFNNDELKESKNSSQIGRMFNSLIDQATNSTSNHLYAKGDVNTSASKVYGMVQCTQDLSLSQCRNCLSSALTKFANTTDCPAGKIGKRILTPSCNTRYEVYPFLRNHSIKPPELGNRTHNDTKVSQPGETKSKKLAVAISTTLSATLVIVLLGCCTYCKRRKGKEEKDNQPGDQLLDLTEDNSQGDHLFDLSEDNQLTESFDGETVVKSNKFPLIRLDLIRTATKQFSVENKLGEGGFGPVYKGTLADGKEIAIKRLSRNSGQGLQEFKAEVTLVAKLQHKNLVRLLGCCLEGKELLLVYDYMPNKSLDVHLFDSTRGRQLDWKRRLNIINGIARGILYLHEDSRLKIIHRDLKASNILLDHDMNPKISDFGMARIFGSNQIEANTNRVVGTYGYMAPEYAMEGIYSVKSDVFSFGVLLLEIASGRKNSGFHLAGHGHSLLTYAWELWSAGQALELMDPLLADTYEETEVLKCVQIGLLCVQEDPADRPTMSDVIHMLGSSTMPISQPAEPAFSVGRVVPFSQQQTTDFGSSVSMPSSNVKSKEIETSESICDLTISESLPR